MLNKSSLKQCLPSSLLGVLAKHQAQMDMILERIDGTGHKKKVFMTVEDYSRKQEEMEALQFKLQEMDNQKKEFKGFLKCTIACHQFSPVSYPFVPDVWQVHR
jgi:hypothetical protein